jgi:hypothetical protein
VRGQVDGILGALARTDQTLATALATAKPTDDAGLEAGAVHTSKGQTVADTAQIDLYDGKLYLCMRDLNSAARKAIRNGDLRAGLHEYASHHLKNSGNPAPAPAPVPAPAKTT